MDENGAAVKSVDPRAVDAATGFMPESNMNFMGGMIDMLVHMHRTISPWWSKQRDAELRAFWKDGESGSIVMGLAQNKLATIPILQEMVTLMEKLDSLSEDMPPFEGTDQEKQVLAQYLFRLSRKK